MASFQQQHIHACPVCTEGRVPLVMMVKPSLMIAQENNIFYAADYLYQSWLPGMARTASPLTGLHIFAVDATNSSRWAGTTL